MSPRDWLLFQVTNDYTNYSSVLFVKKTLQVTWGLGTIYQLSKLSIVTNSSGAQGGGLSLKGSDGISYWENNLSATNDWQLLRVRWSCLEILSACQEV